MTIVFAMCFDRLMSITISSVMFVTRTTTRESVVVSNLCVYEQPWSDLWSQFYAVFISTERCSNLQLDDLWFNFTCQALQERRTL